MDKIYMDYSATTYVKPEVVEAMEPYIKEYFANPSSAYSLSNRAKMIIDESREALANLINAKSSEIYFTSGGTESDNWAIKGVAFANMNKGRHIITSSIEHHAVLNACEYLKKFDFEITYLPVDEYGLIHLQELKNSIRKDTILVSIMIANNEIGTIEPISEIGKVCKERNIVFHTDAVQAVGNIHLDVENMNIDLLSFASHKIYGPKGIGALYIRKGTKIDNLIHGGEQEKGKRGGTENLASIVGFGKASEIALNNLNEHRERLIYLRDILINELLQIPGTKLNGAKGEKRLPGSVNITFNDAQAELMLMMMDREGIFVSSGSACQAGAVEPSHVLKAIGLSNKEAKEAIRFSLGDKTTKEHVDKVINVVRDCVQKLRGY
ncbi:cysteine desulfurase [Clostridium pascui]|uniref:cysteine desulfurase NifS n=1 Tax=Clostridium pascui TaxID=46609 RepID=UPI0019569428|nr:cysteine desulfurase NifS [Clostridium pascui]MBM7870872.1 cysteine desulfurase [Clostridium pascui]